MQLSIFRNFFNRRSTAAIDSLVMITLFLLYVKQFLKKTKKIFPVAFTLFLSFFSRFRQISIQQSRLLLGDRFSPKQVVRVDADRLSEQFNAALPDSHDSLQQFFEQAVPILSAPQTGCIEHIGRVSVSQFSVGIKRDPFLPLYAEQNIEGYILTGSGASSMTSCVHPPLIALSA